MRLTHGTLLLSYGGGDFHRLPPEFRRRTHQGLQGMSLGRHEMDVLRRFWAQRDHSSPRSHLSDHELIEAVDHAIRSGAVKAAYVGAVERFTTIAMLKTATPHTQHRSRPVLWESAHPAKPKFVPGPPKPVSGPSVALPANAGPPVPSSYMDRLIIVSELAEKGMEADAAAQLKQLFSKENLPYLVGGIIVFGGLSYATAGATDELLLLYIAYTYGPSAARSLLNNTITFVEKLCNAKQPSDLQASADAMAKVIEAIGAIGLWALLYRIHTGPRGGGGGLASTGGEDLDAPFQLGPRVTGDPPPVSVPRPVPKPPMVPEGTAPPPFAPSGDSLLEDGGIPVKNGIRYGPSNGPGPLGQEVASTFRSSSYTQEVLQQETTLYRVFGGEAGPIGSYWTDVPPTGPLQSVQDSALNPEWGNSAEYVSTIQVPAGTTVYRGFAAPQPLEGGGGLIGGGSQVYVPRVNPDWLVH